MTNNTVKLRFSCCQIEILNFQCCLGLIQLGLFDWIDFKAQSTGHPDLFSSHWCHQRSCHRWAMANCNATLAGILSYLLQQLKSVTISVRSFHMAHVLFVEAWHHSAPQATALTDSPTADPVQLQVSAWDSTLIPRWLHDWCWGLDSADTCTPPSHCRWMSTVHGCPPCTIGPSLLLPVLGTVCPNMSYLHPLCLSSDHTSRLYSSRIPSHDCFTSIFIAHVQWQSSLSDSWIFLFTYLPSPCTGEYAMKLLIIWDKWDICNPWQFPAWSSPAFVQHNHIWQYIVIKCQNFHYNGKVWHRLSWHC